MKMEDGSNQMDRNGLDGNFSKLTFYQWMDHEYGDDWPTDDEGLLVWSRYIEYVNE